MIRNVVAVGSLVVYGLLSTYLEFSSPTRPLSLYVSYPTGIDILDPSLVIGYASQAEFSIKVPLSWTCIDLPCGPLLLSPLTTD